MPLLRRLTALVLLLSVFTTVCEACAPMLVADVCCPEPCHECACYDAQPAEQAPLMAPVTPDLRSEVACFGISRAAQVVPPARETVTKPVSAVVAPAHPPSLSMLSVYRI